jgi:hypothetical protein
MEVWLYTFLTSALDWGNGQRPDRFNLWERAPPRTYSIGWMGPRAGLSAVEKEKIYFPCRELNHDSLAVQPVARRYTDWANAASG